jgi:hypothetical protein
MPSDLKSETARLNGAKSRGPKTPEGLEASSRNAIKHGFTSKSIIVLDCEDPTEFHMILNDFFTTYQPASVAERDVVEEMVAARWRIRRMWTVETCMLNAEIRNQRIKIDTTDSSVHLAAAFRTLAEDSPALALTSRYEARLQRIYDRAHRTLRELQQNRPPTQPTDSEPQPTPDPPPAENCETNPGANDPIKINNTDPPLHSPNSCRRLNLSDVECKASPISISHRPTPPPCKHYYFGHRIRPRVRLFGRVSEGHQRG